MSSRTNEILLRRRQKVIVSEGTESQPAAVLAAFLKNLEGLGYTTSPTLFACLVTLSEAELTRTQKNLLTTLQKIRGAHVPYTPMYPNFPQQVMEASEAELYVNAIMHYLGDVLELRILPQYEKTPRPPLSDTLSLEVIDLGDESDLFEIGRNLIGAKTSISTIDQADVAALVETYADRLAAILPDEITHKENLSYLTGLLWDHPAADHLLCRYFKTATDVLRLAVSLSSGDLSLATADRLRNFKRRERRLLLALLERINVPLPEMYRRRERFLRLGERLHPGEHRKRFPRTAEAFDHLRRHQTLETPSFESRVEDALRKKTVKDAVALLSKRPGVFARRLDHLLRQDESKSTSTIEAFSKVASDIATPVVLQVMKHFEVRAERVEPQDEPANDLLRVFFPKGQVAQVMTVPDNRSAIDADVCQAVVDICRQTLLDRFSERPPLGKVYVDPQLSDYLVPFSQRSAQRSLRTLVRGSRLPMPEGSTIRFFLWWKEGKVNGNKTGRIDVDLSAVMYGEDWSYKEHVSYTNLKSARYRAFHSGDITSAPKGACEFIDLDIPSVLRYGGRYVVMSVNSYTGQPFIEMPEAFAGWMARDNPDSGEVFEPQTVVDKVDLSADTRICIPVILDLEARQVVWTDLALRNHPRWAINIESNQRGMVQIGRALTELAKPDLYTLLSLHGTARGTMVERPEDADVVLSVAAGTPFEVDTLMSQYL